jgi:hypothetical protein
MKVMKKQAFRKNYLSTTPPENEEPLDKVETVLAIAVLAIAAVAIISFTIFVSINIKFI